MISLQNRLALTYALFISLALGILTLVINVFTGVFFTALVKDNIAEKSGEIVRAIGDQYNPVRRTFDGASIEAMGMYFVHEGYIVTVEDKMGNPVWDARSCDMRECRNVINNIAGRMEGQFRLNGAMQTQVFPLSFSGRAIGTVTIETYGPFFYSETETQFLKSINRLLFAAGVALILFSVGVSIALSRAIARPILKAKEAARRIAQTHSGGANSERLVIRIEDQYRTRELAELSRAINDLALELEEAERRQKQLTADIAHELRTPLTCLQGDVEAMIDGVYEPGRERLESCHEEIIRLATLVEDLNTLTGLEWEHITLNKTEFDLAKLLYLTADQFRPAAGEKGITIHVNLAETAVTADYDRLKQVFINLLSNAIKYTDSGNITISIENTERLCVCFSDTGIGIPESDLPYIFERLYRSDKSRGRGTGGAGIGLAIAAAIVRAHGGTISAESGGTGTVFRVCL
jgi:signal transduction histidine kinase